MNIPKKQRSRVYVALIRAINVGGTGILRMSELKDRFESLGFKDVATYIQSGNVVFSTDETDRDRLSRSIEAGLSVIVGRPVKIFLWTPEELKKAASENPFEPERLDEEQRCHLMFLSGVPTVARRRALMGMQGEEYRFSFKGKVLYFAYSRKYDGIRRMIDFEKVLDVSGTARSWKVVDKLIEIAGRT
jgi:uncharacterized protein (DUF1697 family)